MIIIKPLCPEVTLPSEGFKLPPNFDIMSVLRQFPRDSACGPSGLRIQHLIEAAEVHLPISICSSLRAIVNILAGGRAPTGVAKFLAGGSHMALIKYEEESPLDIRPIAVGEALRRLTGKCLCIISRVKASEFFSPLQLGVACSVGAEKLVHGFRHCISEHWEEDDFVAVRNAGITTRPSRGVCNSLPGTFQVGFLLLWTTSQLVALHGYSWV